ncbi:MAG TPA: cysteine hydrolase [Candidatus Acidoferrales bacterium]|nr:cysteine hydrolase [Candidatus Acidoferrales bacterium]
MIEFAGREIPLELAEVVDPRRTVLLVWDMQNDQAGAAFNKQELIAKLPRLIAAARQARLKIIYSQSTPYAWEDESPAWIRRAMKEQGADHPAKLKPRRGRGSFGWQLMEPFKPEPGDLVLEKRRGTMFLGTEFESVLVHRRATTVVITGCRTDAGIEGTVRDGMYRGYFMVVVKDCVGTDSEERHNGALARMERFADIVGSEELIAIWRGRP